MKTRLQGLQKHYTVKRGCIVYKGDEALKKQWICGGNDGSRYFIYMEVNSEPIKSDDNCGKTKL